MIARLDSNEVSSFLTDAIARNITDDEDSLLIVSYMIGTKIAPDYIKLFDSCINYSFSANKIIYSFAAGNIFPNNTEMRRLHRDYSKLSCYDEIVEILENRE